MAWQQKKELYGLQLSWKSIRMYFQKNTPKAGDVYKQ